MDKPTSGEVKEMILKHANLIVEYKGEYTGVHEMRKHIAWYTGGLPHSAELRRLCNTMETYEELKDLINERLQYIKGFLLTMAKALVIIKCKTLNKFDWRKQ